MSQYVAHEYETMPAKNNAHKLPGFARLTSAASFAIAVLSTIPGAHAVGLAELDVRSYLGEPLNLRIGIIAQPGEELDASCFAVISPSSGEPAIVRKDVRVTLVESKSARFLQLTGTNAYNEPIARLSVRAACKSESGVVRDYAILLDPAPLLTPTAGKLVVDTSPSTAQVGGPASNAVQPLAADTRARDATANGVWTIYAGDTLNNIARGIHPNSRSRRAQYIASLRRLNPALADIADNTPLLPNGQLNLPDLKSLSGTTPMRVEASIAANESAQPATPAAGEAEKISRAERRRRAREARAAESAFADATNQPVKAAPNNLPVARTAKVNSASASNSTANTASKPASANTKQQPGFSLKISGGDIDVSRSQGVSEEVRAQLRERQSLLDSDDQVAQMLALKNSVKQIEKRLNDMQLKMSGLPSVPAADVKTPSPVVAPAVVTAPAVPKAAEPTTVEPPAITPAPATPAVTPEAAAVPAAKPAPKVVEAVKPKPITRDDDGFFGIPYAWLAGAGALLAAALAWFFIRRRNSQPSLFNGQRAETNPAGRDEFNKWADEPDTVWLEENQAANKAPSQASSTYAPKTERTSRPVSDEAADEASKARSAALLMGAGRAQPQSPTKASATAQEAIDILLKPVSTVKQADPPAAANIDFNSPLDLSLGDDDIDLPVLNMGSNQIVEIPELREGQTRDDRLQRLRYIEERLPELASKTVSVDEPDTVINAARSYFEEDQQARACELLIFATEERPQEIRYWLAQFEIYRVEKLVKPYGELATKFHKHFGHTAVWNKVRHVGHEIDPSNTLFAAAGNAPDGEQFNPLAENWLNAPNASISSALAADLRKSLFEDHEVSATDFMSVTQRIAVLR
jgi:hypothetical protein